MHSLQTALKEHMQQLLIITTNEKVENKLSYLTGFDVEVLGSSPNMCSHDKHCASDIALHTHP